MEQRTTLLGPDRIRLSAWRLLSLSLGGVGYPRATLAVKISWGVVTLWQPCATVVVEMHPPVLALSDGNDVSI